MAPTRGTAVTEVQAWLGGLVKSQPLAGHASCHGELSKVRSGLKGKSFGREPELVT